MYNILEIMVKNTKGGSGHKSQARKFSSDTPKQSAMTRFAVDVSEIYAQVTAVLGNGMCHVLCANNTKKLCIIRGKFRGRGKRDCIISNGKWILIGLREFESEKTGIGKDLDKCDLLEVYSDLDKDRLKAQVTTINWSIFSDNEYSTHSKDNDVEFKEDREDEYKKLIAQDLTGVAPKNISLNIEKGEEDTVVAFDDI